MSRVFWLLVLFPTLAAAADSDSARRHFDKGLSAFALGRYAEAADQYEQAFALHADSALLYNAAQAHRLAGNKERALLLYQNYLRLFEKVANRVEVQRHIAELKSAIDSERHARTSPPTETVPPPPELPAPHQATLQPSLAPPVVVTPPPSPSLVVVERPERKPPKRWVWALVGTGAAAAVAVGLGVGLGLGLGGDRDPSAALGTARVR
jgi:tetratricopeptide (TPR) repeat protein